MKCAENSTNSSPAIASHASLERMAAHMRDDREGVAVHASRLTEVGPTRTGRRKRLDAVAVILVEQSKLFRAGLRHILSGTRFQIAADCGSLAEVPPAAFGRGATVVVIGPVRDMPCILHAIRNLKDQHPELRVVMLRDRIDVGDLAEAMGSGVDSCLLRDEVEPETILKSLEMVLADGVVVSPGLFKLMGMTSRGGDAELPERSGGGVDSAERSIEVVPPAPVSIATESEARPDGGLARLSERERLILTHLTLGASNKQIARKLDVAEATVKAHIKSLLRKLRVSNRTQAAMWAMSRGVAEDRPRAAE